MNNQYEKMCGGAPVTYYQGICLEGLWKRTKPQSRWPVPGPTGHSNTKELLITSGNNCKSAQIAKVLLKPLQPWVKRETVPTMWGRNWRAMCSTFV